jgi:putative ubiquitin-RnfH superfamily antitoxin RatB of RatAB toxin-antitoxin module
MKIEVAYARAERQWLIALELEPGATAGDALRQSGLLEQHPDLAQAPLAIFGRAVDASRALRDGDRVELLRPLLADPKEVRRSLAAQGKTMGRRRPGQP